MKVIVIAKSPIPGRVKTRLCPPCTPDEAAQIAEAALKDTLDAVCAVRHADVVLALEGPAGGWLPRAVRIVAQRGDGLDERIEHAFCDAGTPALLIGMDTPQVTPMQLTNAIRTLQSPGVDSVLGEAVDGGWWAAGLREFVPNAFRGVPMSTPRTGREQGARLRSLGMTVARLPQLQDVDTFDDALAVAHLAPHGRFAGAVGNTRSVLEGVS